MSTLQEPLHHETDYEQHVENAQMSLAEKGLQVGAAAIVAAELTPANEAARVFIGGIAEVVASNPTITTASVAAATFAIEASAAVATAHLMQSAGGQKASNWVNQKMQRLNIGKDGRQTGVVGDLIIGSTAGSAVAVFAKQSQDPTRTKAQNIRFGIANSAAVTALVSPAVYGVSKIAETYGWDDVGIGALAIGGVAIGVQKAKKMLSKQPEHINMPADEMADYGMARVEKTRYNLSKNEVGQSQVELVELVRKKIGNQVAAVWVPGNTRLANALRTLEAQKFPEIPEIMQDHEDATVFLAIVDGRKHDGAERIVRATRINQITDKSEGSPMLKLAGVKSLIDSGQISEQEIEEFYRNAELDPASTISIESNFRVGERAKRVKGVPLAQLAYLSLIRYARLKANNPDQASIMAHANDATNSSNSRFGVKNQRPFIDRKDLKTPTVGGQFDDEYKPVMYTYDKSVERVVNRLGKFALPEIEL